MYYPYLKGHKNGLAGLSELAQKIAKSRAVTPIIEPASTDSLIVSFLQDFKEARMPFVFVTNPPGLPGAKEFINEIYSSMLSGCAFCKMGMMINGRTALAQVEEFLKRFKKSELCLIHFENSPDSKGLMSLIAKTPAIRTQVFVEEGISKRYLLEVDMSTKTVVISNPFRNCSQSSKTRKREFFSRSHALYIQSGFDGFGDFLFAGDESRELCLHADKEVHFPYYRKKTDEIWVRHFAWDVKGNSRAFLKMVEFICSLPQYTRTESLGELLEFNRTGCCPESQTLRRALLKHYIELMIKCIGKKQHSMA
ncbi:MAG TPA: sce7725 family protein [Ignavibacteriales bacterium]|nr:sce7725 family protein [Ignavibacteriales bacterium]